MRFNYEGVVMKSLFTVIVILLLPLSIYGIEWTVEYPMQQPDGSVEKTKISIPPLYNYMNLPYLASRWGCQVIRGDSKKYYSTYLVMNCHLKGNTTRISVDQVLKCNHKTKGELKGYDANENRLSVGLSEEDKRLRTNISLFCKL